MNTILSIVIDKTLHISQPATSHVRKVSIYVPTKEKCVPSENHYFGIDDFSYGGALVDQAEGIFYITPRHFIQNLVSGSTYAYELACTPSHLVEGKDLEILDFGKQHAINRNLLGIYLADFLSSKKKNKYSKAYRIGTILKRLYSDLRVIEMTDQETEVYNRIVKKKYPKEQIELILAQMDFDLQELEQKCDKEVSFPHPNIPHINQFLIRTYNTYLNGVAYGENQT